MGLTSGPIGGTSQDSLGSFQDAFDSQNMSSTLEPREIEPPTVNVPTIDSPEVDVPTIDSPEVDVPASGPVSITVNVPGVSPATFGDFSGPLESQKPPEPPEVPETPEPQISLDDFQGFFSEPLQPETPPPVLTPEGPRKGYAKLSHLEKPPEQIYPRNSREGETTLHRITRELMDIFSPTPKGPLLEAKPLPPEREPQFSSREVPPQETRERFANSGKPPAGVEVDTERMERSLAAISDKTGDVVSAIDKLATITRRNSGAVLS